MKNKPQKMLALLLSAGMAVSTLSLSALADTVEDSNLVNTDTNQVISFEGTVVTDEEGNIIDILDADGNSMSNIPLGPDVEIVPGDGDTTGGDVSNVSQEDGIYDPNYMVDGDGVYVDAYEGNAIGKDGYDWGAQGIQFESTLDKVQSSSEIPEEATGGNGKVTLTVQPGVDVLALYYDRDKEEWVEYELVDAGNGKQVFYVEEFAQSGQYSGQVVFLCRPQEGYLLTDIRGDNTNDTFTDKKGNRYLLEEIIKEQFTTDDDGKHVNSLYEYPDLSGVLGQYQLAGYQAAFGYSRWTGDKGDALTLDTTADVKSYKPTLTLNSELVGDKDEFKVGETVTYKVTLSSTTADGAEGKVKNPTIKIGETVISSENIVDNGDGTFTVKYTVKEGDTKENLKLDATANVTYTYKVPLTNPGKYATSEVKLDGVSTVGANIIVPEEEEGTTPPPTIDEYFTNSTPPVTTPPTTTTTEETVIEDEETPLGELPELPELPEELEILDEETPLGELPEEVLILDEETPLGQLPQTGAEWAPAVALGALGLGLCATGAVTLKKKEDA